MITLKDWSQRQWAAREKSREEVRGQVRRTLAAVLPVGTRVWIYGSLARPGRFHGDSDIDVAVEDARECLPLAAAQNALSAVTGREADVVRLETCRIGPRLMREGELWIL